MSDSKTDAATTAATTTAATATVEPDYTGLTKKQIANKKKRARQKAKKKALAAQKLANPDFEKKQAAFEALAVHAFLKKQNNGISLNMLPSGDRTLVATKNIKAGAVVLECNPFVAVVKDDLVDKICHRCFRSAESLFVCGACSFARFCSKQCMNAFSDIHLAECKALKSLSDAKKLLKKGEDSSTLRVYTRAKHIAYHENAYVEAKLARITAIKNGNKSKVKTVNRAHMKFRPTMGSSYAEVQGLLSHTNAWDKQRKTQLMFYLQEVDKCFDKKVQTTKAESMELLERINVNATPIYNASKQFLGFGLYGPLGYVNHSCRPTCVKSFSLTDDKGTALLYAARDIKQGEEITITYVDVYQDQAVRLTRLQQTHPVKSCSCVRCAEVATDVKLAAKDNLMSGFVCKDCRKSSTILPEGEYPAVLVDGKCTTCSTTYTAAQLEQYLEDAQLMYDAAIEMTGSGENPQTALDTLTKELLEADCGQMLHPFHHIVFNASLVVMNLSRHTNQHHETVVHAQTAVEGLAAYGLDIYPEAADVYYELAEGLLYKAALVGQPESKGQEEVVESLDPDQMTEAQLDLKEKLLGDALKAYALCKKIRSTCLGVKNTLTKQVIKRMHELNMRPPKN